MRLFIGIIIGFLLATSLSFAGDVYVKGGIKMQTGNVLEPGITIYEGPKEPSVKSINDQWKNSTTGIISRYDGSKWVEVPTAEKLAIGVLQKAVDLLTERVNKLEGK